MHRCFVDRTTDFPRELFPLTRKIALVIVEEEGKLSTPLILSFFVPSSLQSRGSQSDSQFVLSVGPYLLTSSIQAKESSRKHRQQVAKRRTSRVSARQSRRSKNPIILVARDCNYRDGIPKWPTFPSCYRDAGKTNYGTRASFIPISAGAFFDRTF